MAIVPLYAFGGMQPIRKSERREHGNMKITTTPSLYIVAMTAQNIWYKTIESNAFTEHE